MFMGTSHYLHAGQNHNVMKAYKSFENVTMFRCVRTIVTDR